MSLADTSAASALACPSPGGAEARRGSQRTPLPPEALARGAWANGKEGEEEPPQLDIIEVDEVDAAGGVHKVRKAVKKMTNIMGWRNNMVKISGCEIVAAAPLMERPDDMPMPS